MIKNESRKQRKINNCPVKSPSPDNMSRNRMTQTMMEISGPQFNMNRPMNISPSKFPTLPYEIMQQKKRKSEEENRNPILISPSIKKGEGFLTTPTRNLKSEKKKSFQIPEISKFEEKVIGDETNENQFEQILHEVSEIFNLVGERKMEESTAKSRNESMNDFKDCLKKLEAIKYHILEWLTKTNQISLKNKAEEENSKLINLNHQMFPLNEYRNDSITESPIKKSPHDDESELSLLQTIEISKENSRLKREITMLKLEIDNVHQEEEHTETGRHEFLERNNAIPRFNQNYEIESSLQRNNKFLKEKIILLENELEDKMDKLINLEKIKSQEIIILKQELAKVNLIRENEMEESNQIIGNPKYRISGGGFYPDQTEFQQPTIHVFDSQKIHQGNNSETFHFPHQEKKNFETEIGNALSIKKGLIWDKEEIVSIYDKQRYPDEEDQYSEAERVDIDTIFATKQELESQISKMKEIYEEKLKENENKYHCHLHKLQEELGEIKKYISQYDISNDFHYEYENEDIKSKMTEEGYEESEEKKEINLLKKENEKLRNLIYETHVEQNTNILSNHKKRKGVENMKKSFTNNIRNDTSEIVTTFDQYFEEKDKRTKN